MLKNKECFCYIDDAVNTSCSGNILNVLWNGAPIHLCSSHFKEFGDV